MSGEQQSSRSERADERRASRPKPPFPSQHQERPGLDPAMRESVLKRGVRADQAAPGSGLGLAIVRDLAETYGGSISLEESPAGGARARLTLPTHHGRSS